MQGIVGSIPWTALVFFTLYLQLLGMTDLAASVLMALFLGATGLLAAMCVLDHLVWCLASTATATSVDKLQGHVTFA